MEKIDKEKIKQWLRQKSGIDIIYPKTNSRETAIILANSVQGSIGILEFLNKEGKITYGVLCNFDRDFFNDDSM